MTGPLSTNPLSIVPMHKEKCVYSVYVCRSSLDFLKEIPNCVTFMVTAGLQFPSIEAKFKFGQTFGSSRNVCFLYC